MGPRTLRSKGRIITRVTPHPSPARRKLTSGEYESMEPEQELHNGSTKSLTQLQAEGRANARRSLLTELASYREASKYQSEEQLARRRRTIENLARSAGIRPKS